MSFVLEQPRPLVLASASPRRQAFLRDLGLKFAVAPAMGREPLPLLGEDPDAYALRTACHKARAALTAVGSSQPAPFLLAADTIVVLEGEILGKPLSPDHALTMLSRLSGRTHTVITACCLLAGDTGETVCFSEQARVTFAPWPTSLLQAYVATGDPMDKAGGYGIQGKGSFLAERIEGSWSTVVGLPVNRVVSVLLEQGAIRPVPASRECSADLQSVREDDHEQHS